MNARLGKVKEYLELYLDEVQELHDLVLLAAEICQTPLASISLLDDKKQYPIINVGTLVETSCELTFCNHTIKQQEILEVPDATKDARFATNPFVLGDSGIRFYAGISLITTDGFAIGSLCVIDHQTKKLTNSQIKSLEIIAKHVIKKLELQKNIQLLKESIRMNEYNEALLEQAEVLQNAFYNGCDYYFLLLNTNFEIISFNTAFDNFFKTRNTDCTLEINKSAFDYLLPHSIPKIETILKNARAGKITTFEILADANTETQSWNKFTVSPTYNSRNELIGIACIGCNIDEDKRQRDKIQLQTESLSQIARLHSHEIRHPLTNILGIIDVLKSENFKMTEEYIGYLESASNELDHVIRKVVLESYQADNKFKNSGIEQMG